MSQLAITDPRHAANGPQVMGHPLGLYILFFVELWERFSYYGMRALLVLFLAAPLIGDNPGYGWSNERTLAFYGWYTMFVYIASIPGGIIADKLIGQKKAVLYGGILLCIGHGILAVDAQWAFFTGLVLIILGVGGLKPNISTMVGGLYKQGDDRRDKGFYVFYIGINIGAFIGSLATGWAAVKYGWHYGFGLAGIGMLLGQIVFFLGQKYLRGVGEYDTSYDEARKATGKKQPNLFLDIFRHKNSLIMTLIVAVIGVIVVFTSSVDYGLLIIGLSIAVGVAVVIYNDGNKVEKDRTLVLFLSFLIVIVFWGAFEQAGGLMNLYAEQNTDRTIGFLNFTVPAAWFQSVNAFFIITLGTAVASFWYWWKKRGKESSSLFKMALGVIIMGLGFLFMAGASMQYAEMGSSAMYWLVLAYLLHTIGELCASPVALSFITKLAPVKYASFMMGAYFAATGLGNKVAGMVGEWSQSAGELEIFVGIFIFCTLFGLLVIALLKPLKRLTHGAEDTSPDLAVEDEGYSRPDKAKNV